MEEIEISLDSVEFDSFTRTLSILKEICDDIDIRGGIIRQRTNDKSTIFQIDLTGILNDVDIPITNLKQKLDLLKIFAGEDVTLKINDENFIISDEYTSISLVKPLSNYITNKFKSEEELQNIFVLKESDLILNTEIPLKVSERLRIISTNFNTNSLNINFNGDNAILSTKTQAKDQKAVLMKDIITNRTIDNSSSSLVLIPFIVDHDGDIGFEMYDNGDNTIINKFECSIANGDEKIEIKIYGKSLINEN